LLSRAGVWLTVAALFVLLVPVIAYAQDSQAITQTQTLTSTDAVSATQPAAAPAAAAAVAPAANQPVPSGQRICVEGSVIDHEEKPLGDGGRVVTALPKAGGAGPSKPVDKNGKFKFEYGELSAGLWTFSIDVKQAEGWAPVTPDSFDVPLAYGQNKCYQIRFKLKQIIVVRVLKIDENHNPLKGWKIRDIEAKVEEYKDIAVFALTKGKWIFTEYAPAGVNYTPILPTTGRQEVNVVANAQAGQAPAVITIRFKNDISVSGCVQVVKRDTTEFPLPGWRIEVRRTNGSVAASGLTDINGAIKFPNLPFGPYTIVEESRSGWEPTESGAYDVILDSTQCVPVTFINRQAPPGFCVEGRKIDTNGKIGLPGWKITIEALDNGGYTPSPNAALTDGLGVYRFTFPSNDYRIPGSRYKLCEEQKAGWLPHTATCQVVQLPRQPGACVKAWDFENQQLGHGRTVPTTTTGSCRVVYTVQMGDTLFGIGARYGVSAHGMIAANPRVLNYIVPGQQICVP
jgi:hypothetical protein